MRAPRKRILGGLLVAATTAACSLVFAQTITYPQPINIAWDAPAVADAVNAYTFKRDGTVLATAVPVATVCPPAAAGCLFPTAAPDPAPHTYCVAAINFWGTSADACSTATVAAPGRSSNVKITK